MKKVLALLFAGFLLFGCVSQPPAATPTPTAVPTATATVVPTPVPTAVPTIAPTPTPTEVPTATATAEPTIVPTPTPSIVSIETMKAKIEADAYKAFNRTIRLDEGQPPGTRFAIQDYSVPLTVKITLLLSDVNAWGAYDHLVTEYGAASNRSKRISKSVNRVSAISTDTDASIECYNWTYKIDYWVSQPYEVNNPWKSGTEVVDAFTSYLIDDCP
ncbi:MAG: hypothetical protein V1881_00435 [Candidatus Micrarchaeota archaeon]